MHATTCEIAPHGFFCGDSVASIDEHELYLCLHCLVQEAGRTLRTAVFEAGKYGCHKTTSFPISRVITSYQPSQKAAHSQAIHPQWPSTRVPSILPELSTHGTHRIPPAPCCRPYCTRCPATNTTITATCYSLPTKKEDKMRHAPRKQTNYPKCTAFRVDTQAGLT